MSAALLLDEDEKGVNTVEAPSDDPGSPLTRHYRVAAITWRRRAPTEAFRVRGRASVMILELGMVIHNVGIAIRSADDCIVVSMPARATVTPSTHELAVEFRSNRAHNIFAKRVWASLLGAFPDAETSPIAVKLVRERTSPSGVHQ